MSETKPAAIGGSSTPTLPRWFFKSQSRYDVDEVAFSPPEDGSAFFSLHFGQAEENSIASESPHKSTFDKINEELGYAEVGGRRVSVSGGLPSRGGGLCLQAELLVHSQDQRIEELTIAEQQRHAPAKPRLIIPQSFATASATTAASLPADSNAPPATPSSPEGPQTIELRHPNIANTTAIGDCSSAFPRQIKLFHDQDASSDEGFSDSEQKGFGIYNKIRSLVLPKTPPPTPSFTPASSPKALRKSAPISPSQAVAVPDPGPRSAEYQSAGGVLVERKMPTYNSFFYRPEREAVAATGEAVSSAGTISPAAATALGGETVQPQLVDGSVAAAAAATVTGKARRPKPSRLREMNFWAPTSM